MSPLAKLMAFDRELLRPQGPRRPLNWFERGLRSVRTPYLAVRGFVHDGGLHRASELSFDTVLAIVPLLALVFSTLKGIGGYEAFIENTMRPWIRYLFRVGEATSTSEAAHGTLLEAFLGVLDVVEQTDIEGLGLFGLAMLLYIVLLLLTTIETAFNEIWGVTQARSLHRKLTDFAAILFVAPLSLSTVAAVASAVSIEGIASPWSRLLREGVTVFSAGVVLVCLYLVMPHRRVKVSSAALGGAVAAAFWYVTLVAHARFQLGVARYNAIYAGFAALPLFLVWVFVSWVVVLLGAELAAAHEEPEEFCWRLSHRQVSFASRQEAMMRMLPPIAEAFMRGSPPPTLQDLAHQAGMSEGLCRSVLDVLVRERFLATVDGASGHAYVLVRNPAEVRVSDALEALRCAEDGLARRNSLVDQLHDELARSPKNVTLDRL